MSKLNDALETAKEAALNFNAAHGKLTAVLLAFFGGLVLGLFF